MTRTPDQIVAAEVHYCVSYLVSTLAGAYGDAMPGDLGDMIEQAAELSYPINDWEEAALQAGWSLESETPTEWRNPEHDGWKFATAQAACEHFGIEPYQREVYEHWIVSDWLADRLIEKGEKVDKDFAGMIVWARTTSGQGIASDSVIETISAEMNAAYPG